MIVAFLILFAISIKGCARDGSMEEIERSRQLWTAYDSVDHDSIPKCKHKIDWETPRDLKLDNPYKLWPDLISTDSTKGGKVLFGFYDVRSLLCRQFVFDPD